MRRIFANDAAASGGSGGPPPLWRPSGPPARRTAAMARRLVQAGRRDECPAGRVFWEDDGPAALSGVLLSGLLRVRRFDAAGRRQVPGLLLPGDLIAAPLLRGRGYGAEAAGKVRLLRIESRRFSQMLAGDEDLRRLRRVQLERQLERVRWLTWMIAALSVEERYCGFLGLATRLMPCRPLRGGGALLRITLPRQDIADLLATTVETVCRLNRKLAQAGLLELQGPDRLRLIDPDAVLRRGHLGPEAMALADTGLDPRSLRPDVGPPAVAPLPSALTPVNDAQAEDVPA